MSGGTLRGRLQLHLLAAIAQFERERIVERVRAGLSRVRAEGRKLGRPKREVPVKALNAVGGLSVDAAAAHLGVSRSTLKRWRRVHKTLSASA